LPNYSDNYLNFNNSMFRDSDSRVPRVSPIEFEANPAAVALSVEDLAEQYRQFLVAEKLSLLPPPIDSFAVGTPEKRKADQQWVAEQKKRHALRKSEIGIMLERMLQAEILRSGWFAGARFFRTSEFDDFHGIDGVLEWKTAGGTMLRLAVDLTGDTTEERLEDKLRRERKLVRVEYFRTAATETTPAMDTSIEVPLVVLGLNGSVLPGILKELKTKKNLKGHWAEVGYLLQAMWQLNRQLNAKKPSDPAFTPVEFMYQALQARVQAKEKEPAFLRLTGATEELFSPFLTPPPGN